MMTAQPIKPNGLQATAKKSINIITNLAKNFLLLVLGCFIAVLIMEVTLRVYNPFLFRVRGDKISLPTNQEYIIHNSHSSKLDDVIIHTKNSLGFRGEDPPENFDNYLTIITVGGSTTESFYLSDDKTWSHILGVLLEKNFDKVWVNNAGLDGHSTFGHLILIEDYIANLKPKIVIFLVGTNDVALAEYSTYDIANIKSGIRFSSIQEFIKSTANYSEVFALILNMQRYVRARDVAHKNIDIIQLKTAQNVSIETKNITIQFHQPYAAAYGERLEKLVETARTHNIEPILVTQTSLYGQSVDEVTGLDLAKLDFDGMSGERRFEILDIYNETTRQVGYKENVFVVDLAAEMPRSSRYYYDFMHYTNEGSQKAAELIYSHLCPYLATKYPEYLIVECGKVGLP